MSNIIYESASSPSPITTFSKSVIASSLFTTAPCAVAMVIAMPRNMIIKTPKTPPKTKRLLYIAFAKSSIPLHLCSSLKLQPRLAVPCLFYYFLGYHQEGCPHRAPNGWKYCHLDEILPLTSVVVLSCPSVLLANTVNNKANARTVKTNIYFILKVNRYFIFIIL